MNSLIRVLFHSRALCLAAFALVALAWGRPAFCGEIHDAAQKGDLERVKALVEANPALVSSKDSNGNTPLHLAALGGHKDVAEFLLANRAEVDARNYRDATPLHMAASSGHTDVAELLLAKQADVNAMTDSCHTPLYEAALTGQKDVAELLLANHADVNAGDRNGKTPLAAATQARSVAVTQLLREHGGQILFRTDQSMEGASAGDSMSPTVGARPQVKPGGNPSERAGTIVGAGSQNVSGYVGRTMFYNGKFYVLGDDKIHALSYRIPNCGRFKDGESVRYKILDSGIQKTAMGIVISVKTLFITKTNSKRPEWSQCGLLSSTDPLGDAVRAGDIAKLKSMLEDNPDLISNTDDGGLSLLHWAAIKGHKEIAELLLAEHAEINFVDSSGYTPLHYAVTGCHNDVAEFLRQHGGR